ncbi:MAG: site-specific integrase [Rhabdochlamydiaceae bacterium]
MGNKSHHITTRAAKPVQKKENRVQRLFANQDVRRWYDNLLRGSAVTAKVRLRNLDSFCRSHDTTPAELASLASRDLRAVEDLMEDHATWMHEKNNSPGYIANHLKAVKSWLRHHDMDIKRRIRISDAGATPTLEGERVPDESEMAEILNRASLRSAATISLMAKSGLRPHVLGSHDGEDGLAIRDLPDIVIQQGLAKCLRNPPRVIVRKTLSKARHQYYTFLTDGATKKVIAYLNDRLQKGETLNAGSPVISPSHDYGTFRGRNSQKKFLPTAQISKMVRDTMRPRFQWRPYVLRAYFDTQLLIAESKGIIAHDFRVFFMGHKGSIEARYTTNKAILPESLVNEMRDAFQRCERFLDLETRQEDQLLKQREELHDIIKGAPPDRVQEMLKVLRSANP